MEPRHPRWVRGLTRDRAYPGTSRTGSRASAEGTHLVGPLSEEERMRRDKAWRLKAKGELDETEEGRRVGSS